MPRKLTRDDEYDIYMQYCTQARPVADLARKWKVARATIYNLITRVRKELAPQLASEITVRKADCHTILMGVLKRATEGFDRSVGVVETVREEPVIGARGKPLVGVKKRTVTSRYQAGDPAFLTEIRGVVADMRRLWGMDAPAKIQVDELPTQMDIAERMKAINERIRQHLIDCNRLPKDSDN